jgi:hypothetical protein
LTERISALTLFSGGLEAHTMPDDSLTLEEIRRMAAEIGMTRLTDGQLQELLRATRTARARRAALPLAGLGPADEPAHVFRLGGEDGR